MNNADQTFRTWNPYQTLKISKWCKLGFVDNAKSPINTFTIIYNVGALNAVMCDVYSMVLDSEGSSMAQQARPGDWHRQAS